MKFSIYLTRRVFAILLSKARMRAFVMGTLFLLLMLLPTCYVQFCCQSKNSCLWCMLAFVSVPSAKTDTHLGEGNPDTLFCLPSGKGSTLKGNNFFRLLYFFYFLE